MNMVEVLQNTVRDPHAEHRYAFPSRVASFKHDRKIEMQRNGLEADEVNEFVRALRTLQNRDNSRKPHVIEKAQHALGKATRHVTHKNTFLLDKMITAVAGNDVDAGGAFFAQVAPYLPEDKLLPFGRGVLAQTRYRIRKTAMSDAVKIKKEDDGAIEAAKYFQKPEPKRRTIHLSDYFKLPLRTQRHQNRIDDYKTALASLNKFVAGAADHTINPRYGNQKDVNKTLEIYESMRKFFDEFSKIHRGKPFAGQIQNASSWFGSAVDSFTEAGRNHPLEIELVDQAIRQ